MCPYYPDDAWGTLREVTRCGWAPVLGIFYFTVGLALRRGILTRVPRPHPALALALGLMLFLVRAIMVENDFGGGAYVGLLAIPPTLYGLYALTPARPFPAVLVTASFPLYLLHKFWLRAGVSLFGPIDNLPKYALAFLSAAGLSLAVSAALSRLSARFASVLFGGRPTAWNGRLKK